MKNSNFIKNSILTLLPISLGLSVLFGVKSPIRSADAYTGVSLPTTIDLNDPSNSSIRSYYSNLNSLSENERKGNNLLKNLKTILSNGQKYYNYDSGDLVWKMYEITDRDWEKSPAGSDSVGTYDSTTNVISDYRYGSNSSHTNNPYIRAYYMDRSQENVVRAWGNHNQDATGINREHLWAKAEGFDGSGAAGARGDPMHLVAANGYANNIHSNHFYGYVDKTRNYEDVKDKYSTLGHNYSGYSQTYPSSTITVFEPQDCDKGDIARAIFYMAARYNNIAGKSASQETFDADNPNLLLTNDLSTWRSSGYTSTATSPGYHGLITDLLEWNRIDPPDDYEIHRNNLLYTNFTNNRNPFIDFPQWADICWGDSTSSADPVSDSINGGTAEKVVTSISVVSSPARTIYTEGESFNSKGLIVNANYTDGTSSTVTNYTYSPSGTLAYGTNKVTISYENKTVDIPITVVRQSTSIIRYFKKVTSNFTSGNYLIVADDYNVAWKNGSSNANDVISVSKDENENIVYTQELANAMFTFNLSNGSIFAPNNKYIYNDGSSVTVLPSDDPVSQTISLSNGVLNVSNSSRTLRFNDTGSNKFFRFYTSGYKDISAYALVEEYEEIVHPTSVTVSPSTLTLEIGNSSLLTAAVSPSDATENTVTWSSNNTNVATVDQSGRIVAVGAGTARITAKSNDSEVNVSGYCTVTVQQSIELDHITVTGDYKTTYYVDEEFDMTNLVVNAVYTQGDQQARVEEVTDDAEFSGFDTSSVGENTVTVSYNGKTTTFTINVFAIPVEENTIKFVSSSLGYENGVVVETISDSNFNVTFDKGTGSVTPKYYTSGSAFRAYGGNTISISGPYKILSVKLVFGAYDGTNEITTDKGTYNSTTGIWTSTGGEDNVTFSIGGTSGNRRISEIHVVYDPDSTTTKELLSISLSGSHPTSFNVGEAFSYEGLVVTAHYNDGSEDTVTPASVTGANTSVTGEQEVTVSYTENEVSKTATYSINVIETVTVDSIALSGSYKTQFYVGEAFDRSDLVVTAHYSNGTTKEVTPTSVSGYDMRTPSSSQTITVLYRENGVEVSNSYTIKVKDILPESLEVSDVAKTEYVVGDDFDDSLTATVTYNNGDTKEVTPTSIDGYDMSTSGEQTVTVQYTEKETTVSNTYTIQVDKLVPVSLAISGEFKQEFFVGETFTHEGLVATVTYNNGSSETVTPAFSSPNMSAAGTKEVTVSYTLNNVTASNTYNITVSSVVPTKIELSGDYKTSYFVGESFSSEGLVVTATYNNGDVATVNPTNISTPTMDSAGNKDVTVTYTYGGTSVYASYTISVTQVVPTSIVASGYKSSFFVGDTFSLGDISLAVTYNDGSKGTKTPTSYDAPDLSTSGTKQVKVYYTENGTTVNTTYNVTVNKVLPSTLAISGTYKTEFNVGDEFTHAGLIATVTFNNGSQRVVTPTFSTPDMSTKGTKVITVSYTENGETASATYNITVNAVVHSVSLDNFNLSIDLHDVVAKTLTATVNADAGATYELNWSVADESVLTISGSGNSISISALKVGSTTITVEVGGKTATCSVTVTSLVSSIEISGENTVELGGNIQLSAVILPSDAVANEVEWSTSNSSILAISASGNNVTVSAVGSSGQKATITASAKDGSGVSDSIEITIISIESIRIEYSGIDNDNKVPFAKYKLGESVDAQVIAVWSNGQTSDVTESASKQFKISTFVLGEQTISASYQGFNASLTLMVTNEGSEAYVGYNSKTRANGEYNATPLQQAEAWADYFVKITGGGEYDGPCKLPETQRQAALDAVWSNLKAEYNFMVDASKDEFCNTSTTSSKISVAMDHYKYVAKTYGLEQFVSNSRNVKPVINNSPSWSKTLTNFSIITAVILVVVGAAIILIFVAVKKNKHR